MYKRNRKIFAFILLLLLWVVFIAVVNPSGNFPLNDDWAYGKPIRSFLEKGYFEFTSWPSMTLIGQLALGLLCAKIFGFSYLVLRMFTLVCGVIATIYVCLIFKKVSGSTLLAYIATLGVFFNPIFFSLSFTFMTDIPFFSFCCLLIYYNLEFFEKGNVLHLLAAGIFSVTAVLIRQPAVVIPLSFFLAALFSRAGTRNKAFLFLLQFLVTLSLLLLYEKYVKYALGYKREFINADMDFIRIILSDPALHVLRFSYVLLKLPVYAGLFTLFLLPFAVPFFKKVVPFRMSLLITILAGTGFGIMSLFILEAQGKRLPFGGGNILGNVGLGPVFLFSSKGQFFLPPWFWQFLTIVGIVNFAILATAVTACFCKSLRERAEPKRIEQWFPAVCMFLYIPIVSVISFFDRYLIPPFLLLLVLMLAMMRDQGLVSAYSRKHFALSSLILIPSLVFALFGTRDYLTWNRARWEGLRYLTSELRVSPLKIDGGFEFNGLYNYGDSVSQGKNWWWVRDDEYVVSFLPMDNYTVLKIFPYQRFLPWRQEEIVVSRRKHI